MTEANEYPVFAGGMTLTKDDLNSLRTFLDVQDTVLGRLLGFGIANGLTGTVASNRVTIQPGLAIDQNGRGILLDAAATANLAAAASERFSFIDPAPGGFTPVLVVRDKAQPAPRCAEDCDSHAAMTQRTASIVVVAGRLRTGLGTFESDPLLALTPMTATAKGVTGPFAQIRDAIAARLDQYGVKLAGTARTRLDSLTLDGIAAVQVYKAAFLNQVLFAMLEYVRCRTLRDYARAGAETPGVALGWANGGTWDCRYRHAYVPSTGMAMALLGGGCGDPCSLLLDRLEAVLDSYLEPVVPKPADPPPRDPPKVDDFHVCPPRKKGRRFVVLDRCKLQIPEYVHPDWWREFTEYEVELNPFIDPLDDPVKNFVDTVLDPFERGTIDLGPAFGKKATETRNVLEQFVGKHVGAPDVRVVMQSNLEHVAGFTPEVTAAVGDTIVLVADAQGKVVGTGRVPVQHTLTEFGSAVQDAVTNSATAVAAVQDFQGGVANVVQAQVQSQLATQMGTFAQQFQALQSALPSSADLAALRNDINALKGWRPSVDANLLAMNTQTDLIAKAVFKTEVPTKTIEAATTHEAAAYLDAVKTLVATEIAQPEEVTGFVQADTILTTLRETPTRTITTEERATTFQAADRLILEAEAMGISQEKLDAARTIIDTAKARYQG